MSDLANWLTSVDARNLNKKEFEAALNEAPRDLFMSLRGNTFNDKLDNLWHLVSMMSKDESEEYVKTDKKSLKIAFASGQESQEIIDFLSMEFNVEVIEDDNPTSSKTKVSNIPDLAIFTDGEDIHPSMYGDVIGEFTSINEDRDKIDNDFYNRHRFVPKLGIGRGAHFLTVQKGGILIQHVDGHDKPHSISTAGTHYDLVESNHHQMMYPYDLNEKNYTILAWSRLFRSSIYLNGSNQEMKLDKDFLEPEIVQYGKFSLCIQARPEISENKNFKRMCLRRISEFLKTEDISKKKSEDEEDYQFTLREEINPPLERYIAGVNVGLSSKPLSYTQLNSKDMLKYDPSKIRIDRGNTNARIEKDPNGGTFSVLYNTETNEILSRIRIPDNYRGFGK